MIEPERAGNDVTTRLRRWGPPGALVLLTVGFLGAQLGKTLLEAGWPMMGDLSLHLVVLHWLRESGLHSWTFGWFAGMPVFYFYFPLPALAAVTAGEVVGLGRAIRLIAVAGPATLAPLAFLLARSSGASRLEAFLAGLAAVLFLSLRGLLELGGSLEAAVLGEYSYSIALSLAVAYLAVLWKEQTSVRSTLVASLLLAGVALSHLIVLAITVGAAAWLLGEREKRRVVLVSWGAGFLLSAFWTVPFLARAGEMATIAWRPFYHGPGTVLRLELGLIGTAVLTGFLLDRRAVRRGVPFLVLAAVGLAFRFLPVPFFPLRTVPVALFGLIALAAMSLPGFVHAVRARRHPLFVSLGLGAWVALASVIMGGFSPRAARFVSEDEIREHPSYSDWLEMRQALASLPSGALFWTRLIGDSGYEYPRDYLFGYAMDQLPVRDGRRSIGGLLQESAPASQYVVEARRNLSGREPRLMRPFHGRPPDAGLGVRQAQRLGARYIVLSGDSAGDRARSHGLLSVRAVGVGWAIAEIRRSATATVLSAVPPDPCPTEAACRTWLATLSPDSATADARLVVAAIEDDAVRLEDGRIRFRTNHAGNPHLLRLSHFPSWRLESPGSGPYRWGPDQMVVVPTTSEVALRFTPGWPVVFGRIVSVTAVLVWVGAFALGSKVRRRTKPQVSRTRA